jgi:hypothetical protein
VALLQTPTRTLAHRPYVAVKLQPKRPEQELPQPPNLSSVIILPVYSNKFTLVRSDTHLSSLLSPLLAGISS